MGRAPCCNEAAGLKKGSWTADEDQKLIAYIQEHGEGGWRALPQKAGLQRCGKSCRLRWFNYLRPDIKRGKLSTEEEQMIIRLHSTLGNRWSAIAKHLPKRTDNEIKNHWNTYLKKRSPQTPIDPNNLAAKLVAPSRCLDALETSHTDGGSVNSDVIDKDSPSSTMSRPVSTSARLLNKMATRLSSPFYCLDTLKSILSMSTDREGNGIEANDNYLQPSASASSLSSRSNGVASDQMATTDDSLAPVTNIFYVDIFRDLYDGVVSAYDYNMESPVYNYPLGISSCDKSTELLI